jgi:hypothetical protein
MGPASTSRCAARGGGSAGFPECVGGSDRRQLVADAHGAVGEDVRAQSAAVHERSQDTAAVEAVEVGARFAQAAAAAARVAEHELAAHERVEVGSSYDDVAAVVDVAVECVEDGGVDEREVAAWSAGAKVPAPVA